MTLDDFEAWFERGVTDGLPVVPPTRARVEAMLGGTRRDRAELLGEMPPNYGRLTVEKAAINAVMAGCRPEYMPVLIACVKAVADAKFNLDAVQTSTHNTSPLPIVNGPVARAIDLNFGYNHTGSRWRATSTIGRALQLTMMNAAARRARSISTRRGTSRAFITSSPRTRTRTRGSRCTWSAVSIETRVS